MLTEDNKGSLEGEEKDVLAGDETLEQDDSKIENIEKEEDSENSIEAQLAQEKDKYLRLFAEFENFKKRTTKERIDLYKTANRELMLALLPALDDIDRALKEIQKAKDKELLKGVELIENKLFTILQDNGLERLEVEVGEELDTDKHEAITQIPAPKESLKNKIVDSIETGYSLNGKVIRFSKVVVGQ